MKNQRNIIVGALIAIVIIAVIIFNLHAKNRLQSPFNPDNQQQTGTQPGYPTGSPSTGTNVRGNTGPDYTPKAGSVTKTSQPVQATQPTEGAVSSRQPTDPALQAFTWLSGSFMDYPRGVTVTAAKAGISGPSYTFSDTFFANSNIKNVQVTTPLDCGNGRTDLPRYNITIEGKQFYKSPDGLWYGVVVGGCNQLFRLTFSPTYPDVSTAAYKNLKAAFGYMVSTYARKH